MKPTVAIDYDGTWASSPKLFAFIAKALHDAGAKVVILTANEDAQKALKQAGPDSYDDVQVVTGKSTKDIATQKAAWLDKNDADLLIDNKDQNIQAASAVCDTAQFFPKQKKSEKKSLAQDLAELRRVHPFAVNTPRSTAVSDR